MHLRCGCDADAGLLYCSDYPAHCLDENEAMLSAILYQTHIKILKILVLFPPLTWY